MLTVGCELRSSSYPEVCQVPTLIIVQTFCRYRFLFGDRAENELIIKYITVARPVLWHDIAYHYLAHQSKKAFSSAPAKWDDAKRATPEWLAL